MQYSPNSIAFPSIAIGGSSSQSVMVQNTGAAPMQISVQMGATSNDGFTPGPTPNFVESDNCGSSLAASAVCTIQVTFEPAPPASDQGGPNRFATLTIFDNAPGDAHTVTLTGQAGNGPVLAVPTAPIVFPSQAAGTSSQPLPVLVSNLGDVPLNITNLSLGGANPSAFSVNLNPSGGSEAGCGAAPTSSVCEITVTFNPSAGATGTLSAAALFTDNAADTPQNISISGAVAGSVALNISPTTLPVQGAFPDSTRARYIRCDESDREQRAGDGAYFRRRESGRLRCGRKQLFGYHAAVYGCPRSFLQRRSKLPAGRRPKRHPLGDTGVNNESGD
jgi:hypothetical protein